MISDNSLSRRNFWILVVNSTVAFVVSYLFVFYLNLFSIVFTAGMFDYDISFNFSHIIYHVKQTDWTHDSVKVIFGSGPLLTFIIGLLSLVAYASMSEETEKIKLYLLWLSLNAFNYVFSGIIIGIIFKVRIAHLFIWMYFNDSQLLMMAIVGFFGILITAFVMTRRIAFSANIYFNDLNERNFPFFIMSQIILPFLLGVMLVVLYFVPQIHVMEMYVWIGLAIILLICSVNISNYDPVYFDEEERSIKVSWVALLISTLLILLLRFTMNHEILLKWSE
ncbi:MAG: hypothetical protein DRI88_05845 [Bacteroidetes bacterium]|nr:MAG: hypothetical protein DRI72_03020 [Bacteroidota bacterium]RLD47591.1 MAG: hypothetical protein DRI88_05845 [Bacteroidota bacterium]RLD71589.1 MAG: hypothetical protein DRI87_06720 [Bacteroidota bacterium]RLD86085.1 MAG: hypothetical protein DRJ02_09205 [Bacteroidota bacterium]